MISVPRTIRSSKPFWPAVWLIDPSLILSWPEIHMGVYTRFKRSPEGLRALVELLETTPIDRRKRMIEMGMAEDAAFTKRAQEFMLSFEDLVQLPDPELAELIALAPPRITACAMSNAEDGTQKRFLRCA